MKKYITILFSLFFIISYIFPLSTIAAESWYYTIVKDGKVTETEWSFPTKTECLNDIKNVDKSWSPSTTCYLAKPIKITSFSPTSGKVGDTITINGENFIGVKEVSFGTVKVDIAFIITDSTTKIRVLGLPSGITTSKITVKTNIHGSATTTTNFTVAANPEMRWWYWDNYSYPKVLMGPGRWEMVGFNDKNTCEKNRNDNFIKNYGGKGTNNYDPCFQNTITWAKEQKANSSTETSGILKTDPVVSLTGENTNSTLTEYTLLAPIGGLTKAPANIGEYFNKIFLIAIGLCAVLAVVMIVIGGVQYMGSQESVFIKSQGGTRVRNAVLGLLIALGAFAILNTINPKLLGGVVNIGQVSAEIVEEENVPWTTYETGDDVTSCPGGFNDVLIKGTTPDKINVCKSIQDKLSNLINAAKAQKGLRLSGTGSRSKATQIKLRTDNCGGAANVYNKSAKCSPATALPGTSNHEKGLAVDFNCNGTGMGKTDTSNVCYQWLRDNASTYGFYNKYDVLKETWHWSTTGY